MVRTGGIVVLATKGHASHMMLFRNPIIEYCENNAENTGYKVPNRLEIKHSGRHQSKAPYKRDNRGREEYETHGFPQERDIPSVPPKSIREGKRCPTDRYQNCRQKRHDP